MTKPKPKLEPLNGKRFSRADLKRAKARLFPSASGGARPLFKRRALAIAWLLLCLCLFDRPARAQITNTTLQMSEVINDPFFGDYVILVGEHLPGFEFTIDYSTDMVQWQSLTWWGCNLSDEVRTTSVNAPVRLSGSAFFRAVNWFCIPVLAPAPAPDLARRPPQDDQAQPFLEFLRAPFAPFAGGAF